MARIYKLKDDKLIDSSSIYHEGETLDELIGNDEKIEGQGESVVTLKGTFEKAPFSKFIVGGNTKQDDVTGVAGTTLTGDEITTTDLDNSKVEILELGGKTSQVTSILPDEYQQVEYVESTGTQYIDTGVNLTEIYGYEIDFESTGFISNIDSLNAIMGTNNAGYDLKLWFSKNNDNRGRNSITYRAESLTTSYIPLSDYYTRHNIKITNNNCYYDNMLLGVYTETTVPTALANVYLFGVNNVNQPTAKYFSKTRLYYLKIYSQNNILIRNFVPCYRKSDNVIGLYDLVTNTFLINAGTGTFLKGSNVSVPNSDFSIPIKNVTGNANVKIQNENLQSGQQLYSKMKSYNSGYVWKATVENKECINFYNSQFMNLNLFNGYKENTQYTILGKFKWVGSQQGDLVIVITYTDNSTTMKYITNYSDWNNVKFISTSNKTIKSISFSFGISCLWALDINSWLIGEGNISSYVPHEEQNLPFTFASGQFLADDEILEDDGIHKKWIEKIFDGTEYWVKRTGKEHTFQVGLSMIRGFCTHYTNFYSQDIDTKNGIYTLNTNVVIITDLRFDTVEDFKAWLTEQYENNTPVIVQYESSRINIIPYNSIQASQYEAIKNATYYNGTTIITSTSDEEPFDLSLTYNKVWDSPSPQDDSEIEALSGNIDLKVCGKNLTSHYDIASIGTDYLTLCNFGEVQTFDKISITAIFDNNPFIDLSASFISYTDDNGQENNLSLSDWGITESPVTGTFVKTLTNVNIKNIVLKNLCTLTGNVKFQIEIGDPTEFEAYKEQSVTFPLKSGQYLMKNDYLADDGIHHKRKRIILNGTENWVRQSTSHTTVNNLYLSVEGYDTPKSGVREILCNITKYNSNAGVDNDTYVNICALNSNQTVFLFDMDLELFPDLTAWTTYLAQQYANNTPVIIEYELADSVLASNVEVYLDDQRAAYTQIKNFYTENEVTNILSNNSISPIFEVETFNNSLEGKIDANNQAIENLKSESLPMVDRVLPVISYDNTASFSIFLPSTRNEKHAAIISSANITSNVAGEFYFYTLDGNVQAEDIDTVGEYEIYGMFIPTNSQILPVKFSGITLTVEGAEIVWQM